MICPAQGPDPVHSCNCLRRESTLSPRQARERFGRPFNALTALLRIVDLGVDARKPLTVTQINTIAGWKERDEEFGVQTCRREATRLAKQILTLQEQNGQEPHRT